MTIRFLQVSNTAVEGGFSMPTTPSKQLGIVEAEGAGSPEDEGLAVATIGHAILSDGGGGEGPERRFQLSPDNHLSAGDVQWMASLMQTLSCSMQGFDEDGLEAAFDDA